jgi:hypothetical protein
MIFFGGREDSGVRDDTYGWNGTVWTTLSNTGPAERMYAAGGSCSLRDRFMVFGGIGYDGNLNDLWEWNGTAWLEVPQPAHRPAVRDSATAVGTPDGFFLFGGGSQSPPNPTPRTNEPWRFASNVWTLLSASGPSPRISHAMAYDPIRDHVVLFGGRVAGPFVIEDDTWVWSAKPVLFTDIPDVDICPASSTQLTITASGDSANTFVSQVQSPTNPDTWIELADGPLMLAETQWGTISGASSATLLVLPDPATYQVATMLQFRAVVSNACGNTFSRSSTLRVCAAGFNCDSFLDFFDYDAYVECFEGGPCTQGRDADFNADDFLDFFDYDAFVEAFETRC